MSIRRRQEEVANVFSVDATEAYSVVVSARIYESLWDFLKAKGLRGRVQENAVGGDEPLHDIQIQKTIPFNDFNNLVNEWKTSFING